MAQVFINTHAEVFTVTDEVLFNSIVLKSNSQSFYRFLWKADDNHAIRFRIVQR